MYLYTKAGAQADGFGFQKYQAGPKAVSGKAQGPAWPGFFWPGFWPQAGAGTSLGPTPGSGPLTTWTWIYKSGVGPPSLWPGHSDLWGRSGPDPGPRGPGLDSGQSRTRYMTSLNNFNYNLYQI